MCQLWPAQAAPSHVPELHDLQGSSGRRAVVAMSADAASTSNARPHPLRELIELLPEAGRREAFTHPSVAGDGQSSYERLEFLGDSVLGLAITDHLFSTHPDLAEGRLSTIRASVVSRRTCAAVARAAGLGQDLVSCGVEQGAQDLASLRQYADHDRILAALVESAIGAGFRALGYSRVAPYVVAAFETHLEAAMSERGDSKSELQELLQRSGDSVTYQLVSTDGPDHDRTFTVSAGVAGSGDVVQATGRSRRAAERAAAALLLEQLEPDGTRSSGGQTNTGDKGMQGCT